MKTRTIIFTSFFTTVIILIVVAAVFTRVSPTMAQNLPANPPAGQVPSLDDSHLTLPGGGGGGHVWTIFGSTFEDLYSSEVHGFDLGGCRYYDVGSSSTFANATVNLPDGAVITWMRFYYIDTLVDFNSNMQLRVYDFDRSYDVSVDLNSTGSSGLGFAQASPLNIVIDNMNHIYMLHMQTNAIEDDMSVCWVQIGYTPPSVFGYALPLVKTQ
jgi:hypothetical protein